MDALSKVVRQEGAEIVLFALREVGVPVEAQEVFISAPKSCQESEWVGNHAFRLQSASTCSHHGMVLCL